MAILERIKNKFESAENQISREIVNIFGDLSEIDETKDPLKYLFVETLLNYTGTDTSIYSDTLEYLHPDQLGECDIVLLKNFNTSSDGSFLSDFDRNYYTALKSVIDLDKTKYSSCYSNTGNIHTFDFSNKLSLTDIYPDETERRDIIKKFNKKRKHIGRLLEDFKEGNRTTYELRRVRNLLFYTALIIACTGLGAATFLYFNRGKPLPPDVTKTSPPVFGTVTDPITTQAPTPKPESVKELRDSEGFYTGEANLKLFNKNGELEAADNYFDAKVVFKDQAEVNNFINNMPTEDKAYLTIKGKVVAILFTRKDGAIIKFRMRKGFNSNKLQFTGVTPEFDQFKKTNPTLPPAPATSKATTIPKTVPTPSTSALDEQYKREAERKPGTRQVARDTDWVFDFTPKDATDTPLAQYKRLAANEKTRGPVLLDSKGNVIKIKVGDEEVAVFSGIQNFRSVEKPAFPASPTPLP